MRFYWEYGEEAFAANYALVTRIGSHLPWLVRGLFAEVAFLMPWLLVLALE